MKTTLLIGLVSALGASALFNLGAALQALDARVAPKALGLRVTLLWRLFHHPRWVLGFALGLIGVGPQLLAYADAPFVIAQPALASGLLLLLAIGKRLLGERVGVLESIGVIAIIGGVALVAWGAPGHVEAHRGGFAVIAVVAGISVLGLYPFALRGTRWDGALSMILASGCGFAATNVATKLVGDDIGSHLSKAAIWAVVGLAMGVAATITGMTAFQRSPATTVVPLSTAVQTFLPIVVEPLFLREHWGSAIFDGVPLVSGLLLALVGCVLLSRTRAVSQLLADAAG